MSLRRDQWTLLGASMASVTLWAIPFLRPFALPLIYLNTHIHELCHAVTTIATGGAVENIIVLGDGSGSTPVIGGSMFLIASAGYVGSALVGGVLLAFSRTPKQATSMLWLTFGFVLASLVLFVRGDWIGVWSGVFWVLTLALLARELRGPNAVFAAQFLGMQMALTSLQAFLVLLKITSVTETRSDALILQQVTGIPAFTWALGWFVFGLFSIGLALLSAWRPPARSTSDA